MYIFFARVNNIFIYITVFVPIVLLNIRNTFNLNTHKLTQWNVYYSLIYYYIIMCINCNWTGVLDIPSLYRNFDYFFIYFHKFVPNTFSSVITSQLFYIFFLWTHNLNFLFTKNKKYDTWNDKETPLPYVFGPILLIWLGDTCFPGNKSENIRGICIHVALSVCRVCLTMAGTLYCYIITLLLFSVVVLKWEKLLDITLSHLVYIV